MTQVPEIGAIQRIAAIRAPESDQRMCGCLKNERQKSRKLK
jgi:hypothetical protein